MGIHCVCQFVLIVSLKESEEVKILRPILCLILCLNSQTLFILPLH